MDVSDDKPSEATVGLKSMTGDATINSVSVTVEKQNTDQPKINTKPALNYKSRTAQSTTNRSSSPSFIRTSSIAAETSVSKHAQSTESKKPSTTLAKSSSPSPPTRRSAHSSPLSLPTEPSPPTSTSSSPPSFVSSRSTTPVRDAITEKQNSLRRAFSGQATDGLWPSIRNLSSSFQSESFVHVSKKDGSVRNIDHVLKNSAAASAASERKRTPLKGRNSSEDENHSRVVDQHRWPAMKGGKVSTMAFSRSMDLTDRIGKAASFMIQSRGLSYNHISDIRKRMKGADMEDIHQLRLMCNRELQWHFVNSQAEVALANQKIAAANIFNAWNVTSELQDYVTTEKLKIETLKQEMKLEMLLRAQVSYLDDWIALEGEYSTSLFSTIEALKASTLRLPVTGGARVDVRAVKNAFSSAIDIMQAMGSPVCSLLSRIEGIKCLCCQLSAVVIKEKEMLDECRLLLATTSSMKVQECSMRAHILQQLRQDMLLS